MRLKRLWRIARMIDRLDYREMTSDECQAIRNLIDERAFDTGPVAYDWQTFLADVTTIGLAPNVREYWLHAS